MTLLTEKEVESIHDLKLTIAVKLTALIFHTDPPVKSETNASFSSLYLSEKSIWNGSEFEGVEDDLWIGFPG